MTFEIALLLIILLIALIFFSLERFPADIVALGTLAALILTGLLPLDVAFAGFASETVIILFGLLVLSTALVRTGVVELIGRSIQRQTGNNYNRLFLTIMAVPAALSAFMSNTAVTALFVPVTFALARRAHKSPSRLLMPVAFAAILASSVTLVASSTNLVVSGLMTKSNLPAIGMFEMAPVGIPIMVFGIAYMYFIGRKMIPDRPSPIDLTDEFGIQPYLTECVISPGSPLVGKTLKQTGLGHDLDLTVLQVTRQGNQLPAPDADFRFLEWDLLMVEGHRDEILKIKDIQGIDIEADVEVSDPELQSEDVGLAEAILLPRSPLIGRTLERVGFRERYGIQVLGINRSGEPIREKISRTPLHTGDQLLIQGLRRHISLLNDENIVRVITKLESSRINLRQAYLMIIIFAGVLLISALNILPLTVAVLLGVLVSFLTGCITSEEAYRGVEWRAIILIGCMLAVGSAMQVTGAAAYLANLIIQAIDTTQPVWLLSAFFLLTVLLTQPLSNQAAAALVVPIALQTALQLDLNPRTFAIMIAVAASVSYITPMEPSCLIVYGPGHYRFLDFVKVGSLLTILIYVIAILLVPLIWPF